MSAIFGPVYSRRFGASLGIDLSPSHKQCNFDCLYCELAPAKAVKIQTDITAPAEIIGELKEALQHHPALDVITLTANGEPTMYPYLDELIDAIDALKDKTRTLILSNSTGLSDPATFQTLLKLDQVKLSLDAVTPTVFRKIDRPAEGIEISDIIDAMKRFSRSFTGKLFIEILFVKGINDSAEEVEALNRVLHDVHCERIDIGTIDRPPAYPVEGIDYAALCSIANRFDPDLPIHIVTRKRNGIAVSSYSDEEILNTLDKRPLTMDDIHTLFDSDTIMRFEKLLKEGKIVQKERTNIIFYLPSGTQERKRSK